MISTEVTRYCNKVKMAAEDLEEATSYVVNIRWLLEGIILPSVGFIGIVGKYFKHVLMTNSQRVNQLTMQDIKVLLKDDQ